MLQVHLHHAINRYLIRVFQAAPPPLLRLIVLQADQPTGWTARLREALHCVWSVSPGLQMSMPDQPGAQPKVSKDCPSCGLTCAPRFVFWSHVSNHHGHRSSLQQRIATSQCLACGTEFHDRARLHKHLAYRSPKCALHYFTTVPTAAELRADPEVFSTTVKPCHTRALFLPAVRIA
eukprot:UN4360